MSLLPRVLILAAFTVTLFSACASGRVRGGQATEMRQAEEYEPARKVEPPEGNISRETDTYPMLEVDIERRQPPPSTPPEPEPEPKPEPGNDPE